MPTIKIYVDGSFLCHSCPQQSGIGVYFDDNNPRNVSKRIEIYPQTAFKAELAAIKKALTIMHNEPHDNLVIYTDCTRAILWINHRKKCLELDTQECMYSITTSEKEMVDDIVGLIDKREGTVIISHVKAHSGNYKNNQAHRLAVEGAKKQCI